MSVVDGDQYKFLPRTVSTIESITVDGALNETLLDQIVAIQEMVVLIQLRRIKLVLD